MGSKFTPPPNSRNPEFVHYFLPTPKKKLGLKFPLPPNFRIPEFGVIFYPTPLPTCGPRKKTHVFWCFFEFPKSGRQNLPPHSLPTSNSQSWIKIYHPPSNFRNSRRWDYFLPPSKKLGLKFTPPPTTSEIPDLGLFPHPQPYFGVVGKFQPQAPIWEGGCK